jgi:glycosyltransferase involved in cell wall biosynthesis
VTIIPVTIVIPVNNHEQYLEQCLRSIQTGRLQPKEIILVDNGSTDASVAVAEALGIPNLRIIRNGRNLGATKARTLAVDQASSELIAYLDSDDFYGADALALAYETLRQHDLDISLFDLMLVDETGGRPRPFVSGPARPISGERAFALSLGRWQIHGCMVLKKELYVKAVAKLTGAWHSDDEVLTRLIFLEARRIMGSSGVYYYRQVPKPVTLARVLGQIRTNIRVLELAHARREILPSDAPLRAMRNVVTRNLLGLALRTARTHGDLAALRDLHQTYARLNVPFKVADFRYLLMGWIVSAMLKILTRFKGS